jgi:16S rRNA (cytosine967-C5)-methyltransferase
MMPGARVAAAIEILDEISGGLAAEQALTRWARRSRFAGSKDRAAVRDYVFDVMRCRRTVAHYGKGKTGRALMIGLLASKGVALDALFSGEGHAPAPLTSEEQPDHTAPVDRGVLWNLPDWLLEEFDKSLGEAAAQTAMALQSRAPVCLRVNLAKTSRDNAQEMLTRDGIQTMQNPLVNTALNVIEGERKIRNSATYLEGFVELQDAASQAVVDALPVAARALDYCAGGGGKALALAARRDVEVFAHDIDPRRMSDLPARALRSGATVSQLETADLAAAGTFDLVLCDAPCSGSGAWRRAPEGKWTLTPEKLHDLNGIQDHILEKASHLVAPNGTLAYATCSIFSRENRDRVDAFLASHPGWRQVYTKQFIVGDDGDGFFSSHLTRD